MTAAAPTYRPSYRAFSRNGRLHVEIIQIRATTRRACTPERGLAYRCGRGYCPRCDAWRLLEEGRA